MNIKGKKLLFFDGSALASNAVKRAKLHGVYTIVANFYPPEKSPAKLVADEQWNVDFSQIDEMVKLIRDNNIDGIFVGWTDSHLPYYAEICEKAGIPCCGTVEQFEILSNDKRKFKDVCRKYGVPTIPEYKIDLNFAKEDLEKFEYPVLVKPADESGSRGVRRCDSEEEFVSYYKELYESSKSKKILVEKYIDSPKEIYLHYTVQDGYISLSSTFMKQKAIGEDKVASSAILHVFPSSYIELYERTAHEAVKNMFEGLGLKNGIVMMQGFIYEDEFYFYESGLRMGGEQFYIFADPINGINALDMMIEFSVTGKMTCGNAKKQDNPYYTKTCCNYYISLKPGVISGIEGIETVEKMPQVLQNATFKKLGDEISATNSLDRVIYRIHVMDNSPEELAETLENISHTLRITDQNGKEMQIEELSYERALEMIKNS